MLAFSNNFLNSPIVIYEVQEISCVAAIGGRIYLTYAQIWPLMTEFFMMIY